MPRGIRKILQKTARRVNWHVAAHAKDGGFFAQGLAQEGYDAGYRDALWDVQLLLSGVMPNRRNYYVVNHPGDDGVNY